MAAVDLEEMVSDVITHKVDALISDQAIQLSVNEHQLAAITGMSESFLKSYFEPLPFVTKLERRAGGNGTRGKKIWLFPEVKEAWRHYLDLRS